LKLNLRTASTTFGVQSNTKQMHRDNQKHRMPLQCPRREGLEGL
jgi:hypothetical protein